MNDQTPEHQSLAHLDSANPDVITSALSTLLTTYVGVKTSTPYSVHAMLWEVMEKVMSAIKAMPAWKSRPYLRYSWSLGAGNWANIPWIALLDTRETTSTEQGIYCVVLFREDMSGFYLCLGQGITRLSRELGKTGAYRELARRAVALRPSLIELQQYGFVVRPRINLHATSALGKGYEKVAIAYKLYSIDSMPTDIEFTVDMSLLLNSYDKATVQFREHLEDPGDALSTRVWVYAPGDRAAFWNDFYDARIMAIGWDELTDLQQYSTLNDHLAAHTAV